MKKFLKWTLPIFFLISLFGSAFFYVIISMRCIPSSCGPIDPVIGAAICTADCGGARSYLLAYILAAVALVLIIFWIKLIVSPKQPKSTNV